MKVLLRCINSSGRFYDHAEINGWSVYSGVRDMHGNRIYEGDKVSGLFVFGKNIVGVCDFLDGSFGLKYEYEGVEKFCPFPNMCNVYLEVIDAEEERA